MRRLKRELWPAVVTINNPETIIEIELWLGKTLGSFKNRWNVVYKFNETDFYFKYQEDAMMFTLKWA